MLYGMYITCSDALNCITTSCDFYIHSLLKCLLCILFLIKTFFQEIYKHGCNVLLCDLLLCVYMFVDSEGVRESVVSECPGATHEDPRRPGVHLEEGSGGVGV